MNVQMCKYANVQICKCANVQMCKCANMQICKCANMQICKYANMQICKYAICKWANRQMCKCANMQICNMQIGKWANRQNEKSFRRLKRCLCWKIIGKKFRVCWEIILLSPSFPRDYWIWFHPRSILIPPSGLLILPSGPRYALALGLVLKWPLGGIKIVLVRFNENEKINAALNVYIFCSILWHMLYNHMKWHLSDISHITYAVKEEGIS